MTIGGDFMPDLFPEDICLAIKKLLSTPPITVPNEDDMGRKITTTVKPLYINPEPEIVVNDYPSLVFYESSVVIDTSRAISGVRGVFDNPQYDEQGLLISLDRRVQPDPYIVYIDVRCYVRFAQQRDLIRKEIYQRLGTRFGRISVNGVNLFTELYSTPLLGTEDRKDSFISANHEGSIGQRKIGAQWRYKVYTYFDIGQRENLKVVRDVLVKHTTLINRE